MLATKSAPIRRSTMRPLMAVALMAMCPPVAPPARVRASDILAWLRGLETDSTTFSAGSTIGCPVCEYARRALGLTTASFSGAFILGRGFDAIGVDDATVRASSYLDRGGWRPDGEPAVLTLAETIEAFEAAIRGRL